MTGYVIFHGNQYSQHPKKDKKEKLGNKMEGDTTVESSKYKEIEFISLKRN